MAESFLKHGAEHFPGCINKKYVDAHHIHHWADGGETKQSNLVSLCKFHLRSVHEGGIAIQVLDDGALRFTKPTANPETALRQDIHSRSAIGGSCRRRIRSMEFV